MQVSYSIRTNKDEDFYLMGRGKFVDVMSQALAGVDEFVRKRCSRVRDYYLTNCVNAIIHKTSVGAALYRERGAFTKLIREVHRIIESRLAELNIGIVYNIDQLCRAVRESSYNNGVVFEKIQDYVNNRFDETQSKQVVRKQEWEDRDLAMPKQIHQEIRDIVFKAHNSNMAKLQSKMQKILEDEVKILDQAGRVLEPLQTEIEDERIAKLNQFFYRLKENFRKKLADDQIRLGREHHQMDQDKVSIEQLRKQIRELTVREGLLRSEESSAKIEMEALKQQNTVLERDIHTCNFERVNLTRQLQKHKDRLEKLKGLVQLQKEQHIRNQTKVMEEISSGESDTDAKEPQSRTSDFRSSYARIDQVSESLLPPVRISNVPGVKVTKATATAAPRTKHVGTLPVKKTGKKKMYTFENGKLQTAYKFE